MQDCFKCSYLCAVTNNHQSHLNPSFSLKKLIRITTIPLSLDKLLGAQLTFMNQHFVVTAIAADAEELKRVARKYGVKHHHVEMTRAITPLQDLRAVYQLYRYLKKVKPEMVHSHTPKAGLVGMMAAYFAGVPVRMHTVAGLPLLEAVGFKRKILNFVEKLTYAFATNVYPNSNGLKNIILQERFCASRKLKVLANGSSNGINTEIFSPATVGISQREELRKELGIASDDFVFLFVGRLVGDKGINELVTAFKRLKNREARSENQTLTTANRQPITNKQQPKLILVGPFEQELDPLFPETLKEIGSNDNIISVGFQQDVRPYFAISDVLVFPSYREGFPNVVLQAGAMELPSIVSDINGCNEIITPLKNGLIVPVKDAAALQSAMEELISNPALYAAMKESARPHIEKHYRQKVVWDALLKEYRELLAEK